eukprot:snap_masked-scaffold_2-processed-gene-2.4-mRNA-1 protein AED:1.00 eAED:1.00 QI:0/0/0/0/1/1/2/0/62
MEQMFVYDSFINESICLDYRVTYCEQSENIKENYYKYMLNDKIIIDFMLRKKNRQRLATCLA